MQLLLLLAAYLATRATLGALLNPPYNGPDEAGHVEYVRTLVESGGRQIMGVEQRQPPLYYLLASIPWRLAEGQPEPTRAFFMRLVTGAAGLGLLLVTWAAARRLWPQRPLLALAAGALATLAPGYLYVLASVSNDPLAACLAGLTVSAALHLSIHASPYGNARLASAGVTVTTASDDATRLDRRWGWWSLWLAAGIAALAAKPTTFPVILATALALAPRFGPPLARHLPAPWRRLLTIAIATGAGAIALALYVWLLRQSPTASPFASLAHHGPPAAARAPFVYVGAGGLGESFRTFWYGFDYLVSWPPELEWPLALSAGAVTAAALVGLAAGARSIPAVLWLAAGAQIAFVIARFSFSLALQNEMGGAAQAKAFFPALLPLALLFAWGLATGARRLGVRYDRWLPVGVFLWLLAMDGTSLAVTLWHHYRWWQVTL